MFNIDIVFDDVSILSVEKEDIFHIESWINRQQVFNVEAGKNYAIKDFYERYLEYYVSEGEYFLKILCDSELIGIIKGRIEFKNPNEVWIMCYLIEFRLYDDDISTKIINEFVKHLYKNYGICNFYTFVSAKNHDMLKLWKNNNFEISRVTSNFLEIDSEDTDILILKKEFSMNKI
ncbi:GNAT family N-acetyltransferase [Clostridium bowmanii]|uniref:GNAT family N-acetyltransferase n=1 Tax=Clostridium bowmanii TaxID=132925 RepID=UPI001C0B8E39|nr:GNAT family N-acetyltransferase [Clostridium bowmanii]MBU3189771.1 GNAT family N-acetyltransferase [Clostridium bowmanii]MCA1074253.1 GNAT family N-acetyltransferase [Clostridium bowmanii]